MSCKFCNEKGKNTVDLLGISICEDCFEHIATTSVFADNYEYNKEVIKSILKKYIEEKDMAP
ncbi:MAG: hypothetical protein GXY88_09525 [Tissierellia bacterium]|nr:hypothetical protein [Tissierellia bacterium]